MNIAIIESKLDARGGSQRQALSLAQAMQRLGHGVTVYAFTCVKEQCFPDIMAELRVVALGSRPVRSREIRIKGLGFLNYIRHSREESLAARRLAAIIDRDTAILNPHDRLGFRVAAYYKTMVRDVPSVVMMSDILTKTWINWRKSQFDPRMRMSPARALWCRIIDFYEVKRFIKPHEYMTVLDTRTKTWAQEYFGKDAVIVRSGLDLARFPYVPRTPSTEKRVKLMVAGVLFLHRRYEDAIAAVRLLLDRGYDATLSIMCEDYKANREYYDYYCRLRALAESLDVAERVVFFGKGPEELLHEAYRTADVYLSPNHLQSWGLAVFEAMASGLPVIVSKTAGASEVLDDGVNALLVPPQSPEAIASAVEKLVDHPEYYQQISIAARKFVEENISWERSAKNMLAVFAQALHEKVHI